MHTKDAGIKGKTLLSRRWYVWFVLICMCKTTLGCNAALEYHDRNTKLYVAVRDYVQDDTLARRFLKHPDPLKLLVLDETTCLPGIDFWDIGGWVQWMGLRGGDPAQQRRFIDSLENFAILTPCSSGKNPSLHELSTTDDRLYTLIFMHIDSTFIPGNDIVSAYLYYNERRADSYDEIANMQSGLAYIIVLDKNGQIRKVFSELVQP